MMQSGSFFSTIGAPPLQSGMPQFRERAVCLPSTEIPTHEYLLEGQGEAGRTGILLVHGLTGTPNEMRVLARGLNNQGYTVLAVQLAGHCGTLQDLVGTSWLDWLCSVRRGADVLARRVDRLFVGGLSMGAVLALALAQERPKQIAGVLALSPVFRHDGWSMPCYTKLSFLLPVFRWLGIGRHSVFFERAPYGIKDEALRARVVAKMRAGDSVASGLPGNPWWSVIEMRKLSASVLRRMEALSVPCLVVHAKNDDIASVSNAFDIVSRARFAEVHLHLLNNSYHMITIDRERRQVIDRAVAFVAAVVGRNQHTGLDHVR